MAPSISILLSSFHPFPTLSFSLPSSTPLASLPHIFSPLLPVDAQVLSTRSGRSIGPSTAGVLSSFNSDPHACFIELRLVPKVLGGKGGFGSQLRAAGGRMSSQKTQNNDSCRDLTGRRLSTIKEAKKLAAAIASEPERQAAQRRAAETKLAELNKEVVRLDALVNGTDEGNVRKRRLDDSKDLEQSREGLDKLKGAVAIAMAKKKKAKLAAASKAGPSEKKPELKVIDEGGEGSPSAPAQDFNAAQVHAETIVVPTPGEDTKPLQAADSLNLNSAIIEVVDAVPTSSLDDTSSSPKPTTQ